MRLFISAFVLGLLASCQAEPAFARPHYRHHVSNYHRSSALQRYHRFVRHRGAIYVARHSHKRTETPSPRHRWAFSAPTVPFSVSHDRPRDCYGIQWCGCWLRHYYGIADRSFNLAINWARMGQPASPQDANVVVWRHHVGRLLAVEGNLILIQSGNDRGAVRTRWVSPRILRGVIAYRRV